MTTLGEKDSRMTLVDGFDRVRNNGTPHPLRPSPSPLSPSSPFSASFDPNGPVPATPDSLTVPTVPARSPARSGSDVWSRSISASLNTLANQFAVASQTLAALPVTADGDDDSAASISTGGITAVQQAQARLEQELDSLREQVTALGEHRRAEKEKERESHILPGDGMWEGIETRFLGIEKKLDDLADMIRLDQARLYARLQNSTVVSNKQTLCALPMANGKTPQNFPATKGEFEHLTKERYEFLLKGYGVPLNGDTAAKRQTLREFIGLSPPAAK